MSDINCEETLNHITDCVECKKQILLHREDILRLSGEDTSDVTMRSIKEQMK